LIPRFGSATLLRLRAIIWKPYGATGEGSTAFGSTINGEFVLSGRKAMPTTSKSSTIT